MKRRPIVPILAVAVAISGCTSYRFNVDAVSATASDEDARSYVIVNANPEIEETDLRYIEAVAFLKAALSAKGMYEAPEGVAPDMAIEFDFGMEPRQEELRAYGRPGTMAIVTTGAKPAAVGLSRENKRDRRVLVPPAEAWGDEGLRVVKVVAYPKYLRITAREWVEGAADQVERELWSVFVSNGDANNDLRRYLPLMLSAAIDAISTETSSDHVVVLKPDDQRVAFVTGVE